MKNIMRLKKNVHLLFSLTFISLFIISCEVDEEQQVANNFNTLVFEDDFEVDGAPDPAKWTYDLTNTDPNGLTGWGNDELQYYTDNLENVKVENGFLVINAMQEDTNGFPYSSGRIKTRNLFEQQYGRFEARMRLPYSPGLWPAFWLLGANCSDPTDNTGIAGNLTWPNCGEIDIFEYKISDPVATGMAATVHGPGYSGGESISVEYSLDDSRFDNEFHIFGMEWTVEYINFYVDGDLYGQITRSEVLEEGDWVFDNPFFMILNLAVGGFGQGAPNTDFPQTMLIDYVRVYQ